MNIYNFIYNLLWIYFAHIFLFLLYIFILFLFEELLRQFLHIYIQISCIYYLNNMKKKDILYKKYIHKKSIRICIRICNLLIIYIFFNKIINMLISFFFLIMRILMFINWFGSIFTIFQQLITTLNILNKIRIYPFKYLNQHEIIA